MEKYKLMRKGELFFKLALPNIIHITVLRSRERQVTLLEHISSKEKAKYQNPLDITQSTPATSHAANSLTSE